LSNTRIEPEDRRDDERGALTMSTIPLHLERKFERRWAARFVSPVASAAPKNIGLKGAFSSLPSKSKRQTRWVEISDGSCSAHVTIPTCKDLSARVIDIVAPIGKQTRRSDEPALG
jgi:hypothetical protein